MGLCFGVLLLFLILLGVLVVFNCNFLIYFYILYLGFVIYWNMLMGLLLLLLMLIFMLVFYFWVGLIWLWVEVDIVWLLCDMESLCVSFDV